MFISSGEHQLTEAELVGFESSNLAEGDKAGWEEGEITAQVMGWLMVFTRWADGSFLGAKSWVFWMLVSKANSLEGTSSSVHF